MMWRFLSTGELRCLELEVPSTAELRCFDDVAIPVKGLVLNC